MLAGQPSDERLLAELYDIEHDEVVSDLPFYREWAQRRPGDVVDLGCGSGRLFRSFLDGGAQRIVGLDASASLLRRARARIARDPHLGSTHARGAIELAQADVRTVRRHDRFALAVLAGVISHLDGVREAFRALTAAGRLLDDGGVLIVDTLGPGGLPLHDLPLSVDWERKVEGRHVVRRSQIERRETAEGLRVAYATITDVKDPDGTIARLPARFSLWYPSPSALLNLAQEAELTVEATYGSHDLDPLEEDSERCIAVLRSSTAAPGRE